ncbi:hypothetical protein CR513_26719, partial [Mucuna pruriens]
MEKKGEKYAKSTNKGRKEVLFKEDDLILYAPRIWGSTTFNVIDLTPFAISTQCPNLRSNSLQKGEDEAYMGDHTQGYQRDVNEEANATLKGPMTRGRLKRI